MKASDIRSKDEASLKAELTDMKKEQFNLRFQQATGQLAKPSRMRDVRRDVARVMTVLTEKNKAKKG
jgi:large subunit ribosomal protein L29